MASCFIISCSSNNQYVYENVGTTRAVAVVEKTPPTNPQVVKTPKVVTPAPSVAPAPTPKVEPQAAPLKKEPAKKAPVVDEDMGTQDSDWVDIVQGNLSQIKPYSAKQQLEIYGSSRTPYPVQRLKATEQTENSNVKRMLRHVRSLPR